MSFHGIDQLIEDFYEDFPDGTVFIMRNYGITDEWQKQFKSVAAAMNGSIAHIKLGQVLTVSMEQGENKPHYFALGSTCWIEKLFPCCIHKKLAQVQFELLNGDKIPLKYGKNDSIIWMYMSYDKSMRTFENRRKYGGCGIIHQCPIIACCKIACYDHLDLNDVHFDFSTLKFHLECHCGYGLKHINDKIGLQSTWQGVIPSWLCCASSKPSLTLNGLKYYTDKFC